MEIDRQERELMHLYLPSNHPDLPWSGVLSGLFVLHVYYWGANQFIVQRALSAKSLTEARFGIILAGFLKLLIPFLSIGTGIAAYYLFQKRGLSVDQDAAFTTLITVFIQPLGYGLVGLVAAGLIGAILSSLDSMMNSAATLLTFDIYKRYINSEADDVRLVHIGKCCMAVLIILAACIASLAMDPNSESSFFLLIARHQANLISGLVVVFVLGMLWKRANATGAFAAILTGVLVSYVFPVIYDLGLRDMLGLKSYFGEQINFLHTMMVSCFFSASVHVCFSLVCCGNKDSSPLTWKDIEGHSDLKLQRLALSSMVTLMLFTLIAILMYTDFLKPVWCGLFAGLWIWGLFLWNIYTSLKFKHEMSALLLKDDRFYSGLLAACAVFMLYFYQ
jgi:SSS family solute:Na+ symporter